jgi:putative peptidoglycan lipid II flippase
LLVLGLAMRAGYLDLDRALMRSLAKFAASGVVLAAALWATAKLASAYLAPLPAFRDETTLLALIAVGAIVYAGSILLLFGTGWLRSLVRS